jgi:PIN domain
MDIILDSNSYLSDVRMESIRFKNFFDYLRRTKSSLVLPRLVREETVARYKHMLETQAKKTEQAVDSLNRLIIDSDSRIQFSIPQPKYQIRDLRKKFRVPSKGVTVRYYPETEGVDIADIYLRGINRRRPANRDGEELRDVILWLVVLRYAEAENKQVGFITNDNGFWDQETVHAHIREDIENRGVKVQVFRTIEDFVRLSAPAPTPVNEAEVLTFFDVTTLSTKIADATRNSLAARRQPWGGSISAQSAELLKATFSKGTVYQINEDTQFFELEYAIEVAARASSAMNVYEPAVEQELTIGAAMRGNLPFTGLATPSPAFGLSGINSFVLNPPLGMTAVVRNVVTNYKVRGSAHVSIRSVKGTPPEIELDKIDTSKVESG